MKCCGCEDHLHTVDHQDFFQLSILAYYFVKLIPNCSWGDGESLTQSSEVFVMSMCR